MRQGVEYLMPDPCVQDILTGREGGLPGQCHLYLMDIEWNGYGYWPGSLPGITASRWTFPVVDAVTPKAPGYIESKPSGSARDRGPGTMTGTEFHPLGPMPGPVTVLGYRPAGLIVYMVTGQCVQSITLS